jgi:NADH-quinone oxidoreductase subunit A
MSDSALFLVLIITACFFVFVCLFLSRLLAPRSSNIQKGQIYECGIPTRGNSWIQFKVGFYLFAILYLVFDVETVLLFPWAVIMKDLGTNGLVCVGFFLVVLTLGLVYAWKKGALKWK